MHGTKALLRSRQLPAWTALWSRSGRSAGQREPNDRQVSHASATLTGEHRHGVTVSDVDRNHHESTELLVTAVLSIHRHVEDTFNPVPYASNGKPVPVSD